MPLPYLQLYKENGNSSEFQSEANYGCISDIYYGLAVACASCRLTRLYVDNLSGLARIPLVNTYARTPQAVWKMGWMPSPAGDHKTHLPPLPLEFLRERDILADFIRRVNTFGECDLSQTALAIVVLVITSRY